MKHVKLGGSLLMAATLFTSCIEQTDVRMHTSINNDGTCTRTVSYSELASQKAHDSLWAESVVQPADTIRFLRDDLNYSFTSFKNGDTVTTVLTHNYQTVEEMTADMPLQLEGQQLQAKSSLEKRFRWFYTDYTFTEVFSNVADIFSHPITDYVDDDVANFWFTGQPNLLEGLSGAEVSEKIEPIERSVTKWLNDNIFQINFDYILNNYDSVINPPLSREKFIEVRDELEKFILKSGNDILDADHKKLFKDFFHSDAYAIFFDETPCGNGLMQENIKFCNIFYLSVPYTLTMPGKIIDAGTGICQNDTVFYSFTGERLIPHDYTISATSRKNNYWAYIVTVIVLIVAAWSIIYRRS